ncbi:MAG: hypothetical protein EOP85_20405, partial [Verrucomicrobiaceae bacterium]
MKSGHANRMLSQLWILLIVPGIPLGVFLLWTHHFVRKLDRESRRPFQEMQRPAGYTLQKRSAGLMDDCMENFMLAMLVGVATWGLHLSELKFKWAPLMVGFIACSVFVFRAGRKMRGIMNCRLGLLGEQVVGQILDRLSSDSVHVFHDIEFSEPGSPT